MYSNDKRIVVTLDAGGTNFVFGAMRGNEYIGSTITYPSNAHDLDLCLVTMVKGFEEVISKLPESPVAISFAFPGPADYARGIIGGYLPNFPSFRAGVALGPMLERKFGIPVYINNDGDLFALGEATAGVLPFINKHLQKKGSHRRYANILGYTFGTGFGIGSVINGSLNRGNNSCIETFCLRNRHHDGIICESSVSVGAMQREYAKLSGEDASALTPKDICEIADGKRPGNREAAIEAFRLFGQAAGDAMATAVSLTDSLVVIGGGLTGASHHILPALLQEMRSELKTMSGESVGRVQMKVYNLDDETELESFAEGSEVQIKVHGTDETVAYCPEKVTGVALSKLGASMAISIGAYVFALTQIDEKR